MKSGEVVAGRYRLDARLGIGGMGEVWKATHGASGCAYALKFMHAYAATSASARQRFTKEARVSAKINHPNVIDIFDAGELDDGTLYLAMELLQGISLGDALHASPPLSVQDLLTVMLDTSRALAAAHAVGVVHRDIKPANIFLHSDATGFASAKILDFGISKYGGNNDENQTKTGAVLGSPRYMSPEQTRSAASVDHRADLWAAGVILFEGLTGTWPHEGDSFSSLVVAICTSPPTSIDLMVPELPEPLRAVVRDCLQPVGQRVQSANQLADRIAAILGDPLFARLPLPRPLHPPNESQRTMTGVRVRPAVLTTTGAPESMRTTQPRRGALPSLPTPLSVRYGSVDPSLGDPSSTEATQVRQVPARLSAIPELAPQLAEPPASFSVTAQLQQPAPSSPGFPAPGFSPSSPGLAAPNLPLSQSSPGLAAPNLPLSQPSPGLAAPNLPLSQSSPGLPAPNLPLSQSSPGLPAPNLPLSQSSPGLPLPRPPSFSPHVKTMPLEAASLLQAELARSGLVAPLAPPPARAPAPTTVLGPPAGGPDPLVGTVSRISFDARPSAIPPEMPAPAPSQPAAPPPPAVAPPGAAPRAAQGLRMMLAALSVLLVGIVIALVSVLRSVPPGASATAARGAARSATQPSSPARASSPAQAATPSASETAAPPATADPSTTPTATPAPVATATPAPVATAAPEPGKTTPPPRAPGRPPPKVPRSKMKQLGSGLD